MDKNIVDRRLHMGYADPGDGLCTVDVSSTNYAIVNSGGEVAYARKILCLGSSGNVVLVFKDGSTATFAIEAGGTAPPEPMYIASVTKSGTTATTLRGIL